MRGASGGDRLGVGGRHDRRHGGLVRPRRLLASGSILVSTAVSRYQTLLLARFVPPAWRANGRDPPRTHRMHRYKAHSRLTCGAFSDKGTEGGEGRSCSPINPGFYLLPMVVRTYAPVGRDTHSQGEPHHEITFRR